MREETDSKQKTSVLYRVAPKVCVVVITASQFLYAILCLNLMSQIRQVPRRRIRRIIVLKYEMLLLLKSPQNSSINYCNHRKQNK